jgi:hypothetical protein
LETSAYQDVNQHVVQRCKGGDNRTQYELYKLYSKAMINVSMRITNDYAEAEDVLQESFISALKNLQAYNIDMKYGSLRVANVSNNIRNIKLASTYIPISLKFEDNSAFNFDVDVQYGDFKVDKDKVNITSLEKDYTSAIYKGRFGNSSGKGAVTITSKYGDVRFLK